MSSDPHARPITIEQLTESYRFDDDLASLLTSFQYRADGITLTAAEPRPLPSAAYSASSAGLEAVFGSDDPLGFACFDDGGHQWVIPVDSALPGPLLNAES